MGGYCRSCGSCLQIKTEKIKQRLDREISDFNSDIHDNIEKVWMRRVNMNRNEGMKMANT